MSGVSVKGGEDKEKRGTAPLPVRGGDRGGKSFLTISGRITVSEGKGGWGVFPGGREEGFRHLWQIHRYW